MSITLIGEKGLLTDGHKYDLNVLRGLEKDRMASQQKRSHVTWLLLVFWLASRWGMILLTAAGSISGEGFSPQPGTWRPSSILKQGCIDNYFSTTNRYS